MRDEQQQQQNEMNLDTFPANSSTTSGQLDILQNAIEQAVGSQTYLK